MLNSYNIYLNMQKLMNMGHSHPNIAFLYAFVGYGFLAFQQILTKYATVSLSSFQLLSIRSFLLIWFSLWVVQSVKCSPYVPSSQCSLRINCSFWTYIASNCGCCHRLNFDIFLCDKNTDQHSDHNFQHGSHLYLLC